MVRTVGKALAFVRPLGAAHLEDIGEIRVELKNQGNLYRGKAIVQQPEILVASRFAQELQSEHMHRSARQISCAVQAGVDVREVHGQEGVVITNGGAQQ